MKHILAIIVGVIIWIYNIPVLWIFGVLSLWHWDADIIAEKIDSLNGLAWIKTTD